MLQLSRSGAHVDVETSRSARHCVGDGGFWNLRKRDCSLHQVSDTLALSNCVCRVSGMNVHAQSLSLQRIVQF